MEISRDIYLERLKRRRGNHMVKVITGVRRCGKPYLLFQLFKRLLLKERISAEFLCKDHQNLLLFVKGTQFCDGNFSGGNAYCFIPIGARASLSSGGCWRGFLVL